MAKVALAPVAVGMTRLHGQGLDVAARPNALRQAVCDYFAQQGGEWELRVQLCTNIEEMPIEDAASEWPESVSPYVPVARIVAPPQPGWTEALSAAIDEGLSFSPWHGLGRTVRWAPSTACARPPTRCRHGCAPLGAAPPSWNRPRSPTCPSDPDPCFIGPPACYNARQPVRRQPTAHRLFSYKPGAHGSHEGRSPRRPIGDTE
ncbi:hypothetical protein [Pseudoduganella chitinolytica]|uniref:Uncharacterized protein n=1 Tax=Pseudoduganella chitinolytica TaxID=34070 RepID=A0ABY8BH54_9BURK|nr:hypothetical protein [Pseudoduganella chitinolytica]WEF35265.1 hypothetical protein PX653_11060 [Pseudoduganella chitinolytica]